MIRLFLSLIIAGLFSPALYAQSKPDWRIGYFHGKQITYQAVGGLAIYQGDIILGRVEDIDSDFLTDLLRDHRVGNAHPDSVFTTATALLWPRGVIPYEIDGALPNQQRITDAINYVNSATPLHWQPHAGEASYVYFKRTVGTGVCNSYIGMTGGPQPINLDDVCLAGSVVHEMGHAIGFYHEHQALRKNQFVTILYENVDKNYWSQFTPLPGERDLGFYDFASRMHYAATSFSSAGDVTIQTVPAGIPIAEPQYYSAGDLDTIFRMYGTAPASFTVTSNPEGLQLIVDGATIVTPQTYNWTPGSTHNVEAPEDAVSEDVTPDQRVDSLHS